MLVVRVRVRTGKEVSVRRVQRRKTRSIHAHGATNLRLFSALAQKHTIVSAPLAPCPIVSLVPLVTRRAGWDANRPSEPGAAACAGAGVAPRGPRRAGGGLPRTPAPPAGDAPCRGDTRSRRHTDWHVPGGLRASAGPATATATLAGRSDGPHPRTPSAHPPPARSAVAERRVPADQGRLGLLPRPGFGREDLQARFVENLNVAHLIKGEPIQ